MLCLNHLIAYGYIFQIDRDWFEVLPNILVIHLTKITDIKVSTFKDNEYDLIIIQHQS